MEVLPDTPGRENLRKKHSYLRGEPGAEGVRYGNEKRQLAMPAYELAQSIRQGQCHFSSPSAEPPCLT